MYAVIDIGSNTIRMVLYKVVNGELRQMLNSKEPAGWWAMWKTEGSPGRASTS